MTGRFGGIRLHESPKRRRDTAHAGRKQRGAAAVQGGVRDGNKGRPGQGLRDVLLQRMRRVKIVGGAPAVHRAGQQHRRVLARTVHANRGTRFPRTNHLLEGCLVFGAIGRAAEG